MLIESMRDVGYSLETALADVIDNSITAGARNIEVLAETTGPSPLVAVVDDGCGMDAEELIEAMRLGSRSPTSARKTDDLGRFGLGMKTASFSQCRRLTVVSRRAGEVAAVRWDLDQVEAADDWVVDIPPSTEDIPWADLLGETGTLVLWEKLDRIVGPDATALQTQHLVRRLSEAAEHLELVFHRFLSGEKGIKRVAIALNGRSLIPFDPFHEKHPATIAGPPDTIRIGRHHVTIQAFTLPHHKKVTADEWERFGGPAGYVKNQGFYVYRARRLIIHGTWFGLARQTELTKLARVRIDMPNGLDADWKVDIKKASAQPPAQVRDRLRQLIETIGANSRRVYTARGRRLANSRLPVWQRLQDKNEIRYRVNEEHPVVTDFLARLPEALQRDFVRVVEMIGSAMPMDAIFADISGHPTQVGGDSISSDALEHAVITTFQHLRRTGLSAAAISEMLQAAEPFRSNWDAAERILRVAELDGKKSV